MEKNLFLEKGFVKWTRLIDSEETNSISQVYQLLLNEKAKTQHLRSDLSGIGEKGKEKITQIMRPSSIHSNLIESKTYQNALEKAKYLLGEDMALDFDMLINKSPDTATETPLHQDAAYWISMPDKRAVSCWIAIDKAEEKNVCMWFIPREWETVFPHQPNVEGGALYCDYSKEKAECVPLEPGDCTFHDGYTLHFSKGNFTKGNRRALILNFRPQKMIELERSLGIDHTGVRKARNK